MTYIPYFMENKDWFKFDFKKRIFVLTDKAPEKAKESYNEFYTAFDSVYGGNNADS